MARMAVNAMGINQNALWLAGGHPVAIMQIDRVITSVGFRYGLVPAVLTVLGDGVNGIDFLLRGKDVGGNVNVDHFSE